MRDRDAAATVRVRLWRSVLVPLVGAVMLGGCSSGTQEAHDAGAPGALTARPERTTAAPAGPEPESRVAAGTCRHDVCAKQDALAVWRSVPFTRRLPCGAGRCRLTMDVYAPAAARHRPVVVLVPGGPNPPDAHGYLTAGAARLAAAGMVVMAVGWRQGAEWDGGYPASFRDVACAVGVARRTAASYGGRGDRVVLAGHSLGGWAAAVVALTPHPFSPPGRCHRQAGPSRPDGLVTLAGAVDEVRHQGLGPGFLDPFFGGPPTQRPRAWRAADPFALAAALPARRVPVTVVQGGRDEAVAPSTARTFHSALKDDGYRARLVVDQRADHTRLLTSRQAVDAVEAAATDPDLAAATEP